MESITNILSYTKKLKDAGESEVVAEIHAEMLAALIENNLATKQDLKNEVSHLEEKIDHVENRLEAKIDNVEARLDEKFTGKFTLLYWMMGFLLSGMATLLLKTI